MSASALMSLGMQAMAANYAALQTTGHNIANANSPGYSRQQVELATAGGQFTGAGFFGKGVDVATVTRAHDEFLTREAASRALAGRAGRGPAASSCSSWRACSAPARPASATPPAQFLNAMVDVASQPARHRRAPGRAGARRRAGRALCATPARSSTTLQAGVDAGPAGQRSPRSTRWPRSIAELNQQIAAVQRPRPAAERPARPARPARSASCSQYVQVTTHRGRRRHAERVHRRRPAPGAGQPGADADGRCRRRRPVALGARRSSDSGIVRDRCRDEALGGGSIAGLLRFQNERPGRRAQPARPAGRGHGRQRQRSSRRCGLDLRHAAGQRRADLFARRRRRRRCPTPPTRVDGAAAARRPASSLTITDRRQLQASDYELRADPAGAPAAGS